MGEASGDRAKAMTEACAHLQVKYETRIDENGWTTGWWQCATESCRTKFTPVASAESAWGDPCRVCLQTGGRHWTTPHVDQSPVVAAQRREEFRNRLTEREKEVFDWVLSRAVWHAVQAEQKRAENLIRQSLLFDSQRAVSWHEVQDCLEALRREPPEPTHG
jgi:hypothetical protein